ncbi:MAG: hypothetical protein RIQ97_2607 [Pseudomonadota bacterium]|jgi:uncharacterized protein YndB with AHSA1/START domain
MTITVSTEVAAPLEVVWRAYTTPADIMVWNSASPDWHTPSASVDLREGGRFCSRMEARDGSMGFDFEGVYTRIVPLQRLEYRFGDRQAQVEFWPGPQAVTVRVSFDPETVFPEDQQRAGWQAILDHFKRHVEGQASA